MEKKLIIFTDIGDTVIDEGTEVRDENAVVVHADCIPGARETMLELYRRGYTIVMVADGLVQSFANTMKQHGLSHIFRAKAISEEVGCEKPGTPMFRAAMDRTDLTEADKRRIIMVGNNMRKDVTGANRFGLRSVLLAWSPRYSYEPETPEQVPDYTLKKPEELLDLVERLEEKL